MLSDIPSANGLNLQMRGRATSTGMRQDLVRRKYCVAEEIGKFRMNIFRYVNVSAIEVKWGGTLVLPALEVGWAGT